MPELIEVTTPRGTMPVHVHRPAGGGPAPVVVLFMDAPGVRPAIQGYAERLAQTGYTAALPDLFYTIPPAERPRPERLAARDPEEFKRMSGVVAQIDDAAVLTDTRLLLDAVGSGERPWGCVGFCMGGRLGLRAAEQFGDTLAAGAFLHPSRLVTDEPDSPHREVGGIGGALYFGYGENDHVTPLDTIPPIREALEGAGVRHVIEVIPDADHGYTMPGMPAYNEAAAERAWAGTIAMLGEHLGGERPGGGHLDGEHLGGERPGGRHLDGEHLGGERPGGEPGGTAEHGSER